MMPLEFKTVSRPRKVKCPKCGTTFLSWQRLGSTVECLAISCRAKGVVADYEVIE